MHSRHLAYEVAGVRILILNWKDLEHTAAGGAEVFVHSVAEELAARGHEITLFAAGIPQAPDEETRQGVRVIRAGGRLSVYRAAREFWAKQPDGSFDVVIDSINTRPFLTPRWISGTPVVALIYQLAREVWRYETPFPVSLLGRHVLEPWWLRAYRETPALTISPSSAASLREHHGWRDVTVVPVGLEAITRPGVPKEALPTVVFLGRLVGMKRPEHAVYAVRGLQRSFPEARLWIIGSGPKERRLRRLASNGIELLGRVSGRERTDRLARAHVLVATSVREGWGLNVSEAAACGTPSIAYAVPGLVDSVRAAGGALVKPRPDALASALTQFFAGKLALTPNIGTSTWSDAAEAVERRLEDVVSAFAAGEHAG